jgi:divinyl chlorophyllide a 8-vinyl-reductase
VVRDAARGAAEPKFEGATIVEADVCDPSSLAKSAAFSKGGVDVVVSCLASRSGSKSDSFAIDYQATLNSLNAARAAGARHFVLLSAYCVKSAERRDPYALQFQYAKMKMEEALRAQSDMTYSIVRPTAFFKSVSGQVEVVSGGAPFVYFDLGGSSYKSSHGDGKCATCNPISEPDLAAALVDTIADPSKCNALWNLGGPDVGLSMREQGELVADVLGKEEAKLLGVPIGIFDVIINGLQASAL